MNDPNGNKSVFDVLADALQGNDIGLSLAERSRILANLHQCNEALADLVVALDEAEDTDG